MTITELAKQLKVSRARVYQIIDALDNKDKPSKDKDGHYILSDQVVNAIRKYYAKTNVKSNKADSSQTLDIIKRQLDIKDQQIAKLQKLVDQSQQLQLQTQKQLEETNKKVKLLEKKPLDLDSKSIKNDSSIITPATGKSSTGSQKNGWFKHLFKR